MTEPNWPDFPLDDDVIDQLAEYPGDLPTTFEHFVDLLPDPRLT